MEEISVVIPAYNEEKNIFQTVDLIEKYFLDHKAKYEIIMVNDGSTDGTNEIMEKLSYGNRRVKIYSYPENKGKGYAVRQGLLEAIYKTVLVLDADYSCTAQGTASLLKKFSKASIIKGQRKQIVRQGITRLLQGKTWKLLVFLATGIYKDTQCPYWIMRMDKIFYTDLKIDGFAYDVEILHKAKKQNYQIKYTEVPYFNDENSSVTLKKTIQMFFDLIRIRLGK